MTGIRMDEGGWDELDALVAAEADRMLRPRPSPEPEVDEKHFLDNATAFLARHAEPARLLGELRMRAGLEAADETPTSPPASDPPTDTPPADAPPEGGAP